MKFEVNTTEPGTALTYPVLMRSVCGRDVTVLFTSRSEGMELTDSGFKPPEGEWVSADDRSEWTPFIGAIKVSA